jgi:TRAP transporter TAXI family solute receptor
VIVEAIAATVKKHTDLRATSMSTSGGAENLQLIGQDALDFGQSASTDYQAARAGEGRFKQAIDVHQTFAYTAWATVPMVRADSGIDSAADLAGKRVSPSTAGGSTRRTWDMMTEFLGVKDDISWTYGSWREVYDAFRAGAVDCVPALLAGGVPSPLLQELMASVEVKGLGWPDGAIQHANSVNPGISRYEVEPRNWSAVSEPTPCTASVGILGANAKVSAETGYEVTRAVMENAEEVRGIAQELQNVSPEYGVRYLMPGVPVNAGAAQWFKENNLWREELTIAS